MDEQPLDNALGDDNENDEELTSLGAKIRDLSAQSDSEGEGGRSLGCSPIEGEGRCAQGELKPIKMNSKTHRFNPL